jgi:hypothetical protein
MYHSIAVRRWLLQFQGQHGLAGAWFAFDEERALESNCGIDRDFQVVGRDISLGAVKTHTINPVAMIHLS